MDQSLVTMELNDRISHLLNMENTVPWSEDFSSCVLLLQQVAEMTQDVIDLRILPSGECIAVAFDYDGSVCARANNKFSDGSFGDAALSPAKLLFRLLKYHFSTDDPLL